MSAQNQEGRPSKDLHFEDDGLVEIEDNAAELDALRARLAQVEAENARLREHYERAETDRSNAAEDFREERARAEQAESCCRQYEAALEEARDKHAEDLLNIATTADANVRGEAKRATYKGIRNYCRRSLADLTRRRAALSPSTPEGEARGV